MNRNPISRPYTWKFQNSRNREGERKKKKTLKLKPDVRKAENQSIQISEKHTAYIEHK